MTDRPYERRLPLLRIGASLRGAVCLLVLTVNLLIFQRTSLADFSSIGDHYKQTLIATSRFHTCALTKTTDAGLRCWGANNTGQLGDGTTVSKTSPVDVVGLSSGVVAVGVGDTFSCALLSTGEVKCWGSNSVGQLGNSSANPIQVTPVSVLDGASPLSDVQILAVGRMHACVVLTSGAAKCWGGNSSGQLGDGTNFNSIVPKTVTGYSSGVKMIDAGGLHTCLVTQPFNEVFCFGNNFYGQLGNNSTANSSVPVQAYGIISGVGVSAGEDHSCARLSTGDIECWGRNAEGTLGDGGTSDSYIPVSTLVISGDGRRVSAGRDHTCATRASDGEVMCWGRGQEGQVGDNTATQRNVPTSTNPALKQAYDISARGSHTCAWMGTCSAKCWGDNTDGQLGNGTTVNASAPVSITFCSLTDPTPTPTPTSTPTPIFTPTFTPTPQPDACASESACVPDDRLTTALDPKPPAISVSSSTSQRTVALNFSSVRIGVPTDPAKRQALRTKLSKFFNRNITSIAGAIKLLEVHLLVSITKVPAISASSLEAFAVPRKYKVETRKRRVTTRLAAGTYVARVTVRLKDARGRTFVTGSNTGQARFTVR